MRQLRPEFLRFDPADRKDILRGRNQFIWIPTWS